jgi:uncharacterized protein YodC (DUF2158 family)
MAHIDRELKDFQRILEISTAMSKSGLPTEYVTDIQSLAVQYEWAEVLMCRWYKEQGKEKRENILTDMALRIIALRDHETLTRSWEWDEKLLGVKNGKQNI